MTRFERGVWSRAAAAASEEERQEEEKQDGERQREGMQGEGMQEEERQGEGRQGEERQGAGLEVRDDERREAERDGTGREAGRREDERMEVPGRTGGVQGVVMNRGRGNIVIPAERWQYVKQQLAIIRSGTLPPAFKAPPMKAQLLWPKATPAAPSPSSPSPSSPSPSSLSSSLDGGESKAGEMRQGSDTTQEGFPHSKPGLLLPEKPALIIPPTGTAATVVTGQEEDTVNLDKGGEEQRTAEWYALRARLTASAFATAVGFFPGGRQQLWEEKLGLKVPFAGNAATDWGQEKEGEALMAYERIIGGKVERKSFQIYKHEDPAFSWLGASPDGLLPSDRLCFHSSPQSPGVLEIKCPFNRGSPLSATPYPSVPVYYMPQIQGLLEIFDRDWLDFFVWTEMGGTALFRVERDKQYWELLFTALEEFWRVYVVPAKEALREGQMEEVRWKYYPAPEHVLMREIEMRSEQLSKGSRMDYRANRRVLY
ncbi:unnamed protein product [Closterium sp. Naga37s-1]|nr:unnamed protein product [Closterium sp. Naga37s-1]